MSKCSCRSINTKCECPVKDLSTDCVIYTGYDTDNIGVITNDALTTVVKKIDERIGKIDPDYWTNRQKITNTGDGSKIYKGEDNLGYAMLRTIKGGDRVDVSTTTDTITINADFTSKIKSKGDGVKILKGFDQEDFALINTIKGEGTVTIEDTEQGIIIKGESTSIPSLSKVGNGVHVNDVSGNNLTTKGIIVNSEPLGLISNITESSQQIGIAQRRLAVSNKGGGERLLNIQGGVDQITIESKSLVSDSLNISGTADEIKVEVGTLGSGGIGSLVGSGGIKEIGLESVGANSTIKEVKGNPTTVTIVPKTLVAGDNISLTPSESSITITALPQDSGDSLKGIYVDASHGGASTGSRLKPFKTLMQALTHYVGTGTASAPQRLGEVIHVFNGNYQLTTSISHKSIKIQMSPFAKINMTEAMQAISDNNLTSNDVISIHGGTFECTSLLNITKGVKLDLKTNIICKAIGVSTVDLELSKVNIELKEAGDVFVNSANIEITDSFIDVSKKTSGSLGGTFSSLSLINNTIKIKDNIPHLFNILSKSDVNLLGNTFIGKIKAIANGNNNGSVLTMLGNKSLKEIDKISDGIAESNILMDGNQFLRVATLGSNYNKGNTTSVTNFINGYRREDLKTYRDRNEATADTTKIKIPYISESLTTGVDHSARDTKI